MVSTAVSTTVSAAQLQLIFPHAGSAAGRFVEPLNSAMAQYAINNHLRIAAFLAQVGHESAQLTCVQENLNYSAAGLQTTWPTRFDKALAQQLARQPEKIANLVYAARMGNGPPESGDGWKYRGRGLIQITGRNNYKATGIGLGLDLLLEPQLLEFPEGAALSAGLFWQQHGLNELADERHFDAITRRINGGLNGQAERLAFYSRALQVLA